MSSVATPSEALQAAVNAAGSQAKLADICGVTQPAVWKWLQNTGRAPAESVLAIEAATGVSRHDLRPDIYPREGEPCSAAREAPSALATGSPNDALNGVQS